MGISLRTRGVLSMSQEDDDTMKKVALAVGAVVVGAGVWYLLTRKKEPKAGPMKNPTFDGSRPVDLSDGKTQWLCRCGQSNNPPFCDGSHKAYNAANGTNFTPFKASKEELGKDKGEPFCDGSHRQHKPKL